MLTIDILREFGANVEEGLGRCLNDEGFYLMLVQMALDDQRIPELENALAANDLEKAFEIAHALKGIYGNVALTPIYAPVSEMTELLRTQTQTDYAPYLEAAKQQKQTLAALAAE